jgi:hypothetical protein
MIVHKLYAPRRHVTSTATSDAASRREQDTVGDMSRDQVSAALERQLQRSKGNAGSDEAGSDAGSNGEVAAVEE